MKNGVVIYESKYGSTKKYAQWIAEELSCDLFERKQIKKDALKQYDVIIYGGGVYAGKVSGAEAVIKAFHTMQDKSLILFTCGLSDPKDVQNAESVETVLRQKMTADTEKNVKIFHFRGGIDYSRLSFADRSIMSMLIKILQKKEPGMLTAQERDMLDSYGKAVDLTDRAAIQPLIAYVQEQCGSLEQ